MSGNCELGRGLRRREKNATEAGAGRLEKPAPDARAAPPEAYESLISRKTGAEVPLTGLSFLAKDGSLRMRPLRELEQLRHGEQTTGDVVVKGDGAQVLDAIAGDTLELEVVFAKPTAKECGMVLFCDDAAKNGIEIGHGAGRKSLTVDYIEPPFALAEGEDLTMRIFIDKSMVEVFANDRQAAVAWHEPTPDRLRIGVFSRGGDSTARVKAWKMRSIYKPAE